MGQLGDAAKFIENTLATFVPMLLDFLARLLRLGNVSEKIKKILQRVRKPIDDLIAKVMAWIKKKIRGGRGKDKKKNKEDREKDKKDKNKTKGEQTFRFPFVMDKHDHHILVRVLKSGKIKITMASDEKDLRKRWERFQKAVEEYKEEKKKYEAKQEDKLLESIDKLPAKEVEKEEAKYETMLKDSPDKILAEADSIIKKLLETTNDLATYVEKHSDDFSGSINNQASSIKTKGKGKFKDSDKDKIIAHRKEKVDAIVMKLSKWGDKYDIDDLNEDAIKLKNEEKAKQAAATKKQQEEAARKQKAAAAKQAKLATVKEIFGASTLSALEATPEVNMTRLTQNVLSIQDGNKQVTKSKSFDKHSAQVQEYINKGTQALREVVKNFGAFEVGEELAKVKGVPSHQMLSTVRKNLSSRPSINVQYIKYADASDIQKTSGQGLKPHMSELAGHLPQKKTISSLQLISKTGSKTNPEEILYGDVSDPKIFVSGGDQYGFGEKDDQGKSKYKTTLGVKKRGPGKAVNPNDEQYNLTKYTHQVYEDKGGQTGHRFRDTEVQIFEHLLRYFDQNKNNKSLQQAEIIRLFIRIDVCPSCQTLMYRLKSLSGKYPQLKGKTIEAIHTIKL